MIFQYSNFEEEVFFQGSDFIIEPTFADANFESPTAKENSYRIQRIMAEEKRNKEKADSAFVEEMRARREQKRDSESLRENIRGYFEEPLADWTCEYGTNWFRVVWVSLALIFTFSLVFLFGSYWNGLGHVHNLGELSFANFFYSLNYSTITFTTLGYGFMHPEGVVLGALSALESLLGAFFMALLVVVLARRWMR